VTTWFLVIVGFAFLLVAVHRNGKALAALFGVISMAVGLAGIWGSITTEAYSPAGEQVALIPSWAGTCYLTGAEETAGGSLREEGGYYYLSAGPSGPAACECVDVRELIPWR